MSLIDIDSLLADFDGDTDFLKDVLHDVKDDLSSYMKTLRKSIETKDSENMKLSSHSIKGICLTTKCNCCVEPSKEIERISKQLLDNNREEECKLSFHMNLLEHDISVLTKYIDETVMKN